MASIYLKTWKYVNWITGMPKIILQTYGQSKGLIFKESGEMLSGVTKRLKKEYLDGMQNQLSVSGYIGDYTQDHGLANSKKIFG